MNLYTYDFEVQTMSNMFINAFSDITVKRLNVHKQPRDEIKTRVVYAPKQRILADLLDKDQNLQLPVISVSIGGISRDETRVSNKILGTYHISSLTNNKSSLERTPIPVDIRYNVSIMTRYQQDMDQILSHILPYINPYFVISWRTPSRPDFEIRSNVYWDGNANVQYPVELNSSQLARVVADLSFTFKGWIFQRAEEATNIYTFDTSLISVPGINTQIDSSYKELSASVQRTTYSVVPPKPRFIAPDSVAINSNQQFEVWGSGFETITNVYLSGIPLYNFSTLCNPFSSFTELSANNPPFFAYKLTQGIDWASDNVSYMTFIMPSANLAGRLDLIVENIRGYGKLTDFVRRDNTNPLPETHPLHNTYISYQVPYLSGIEVYGTNHPYSHGTFWSNEKILGLGSSLYLSPSADNPISILTNYELNGHLITTNSTGLITNYTQILHSNSLNLSGQNYFHDGVLTNGLTILYPLSNTLVKAGALSGIWDIEGDSFPDNFSVNNNGIIFWRAIDFHDYQHGNYWSDDEAIGIGSVLFDAQISRTIIPNLHKYPINGYEIDTDFNGVITSYVYIHANFISLDGQMYYYDGVLTNNSSYIYQQRDTDNKVVNLNGVSNITGDLNAEQWVVNEQGIISWVMMSAYPYEYFGYYSDSPSLISGSSKLYIAQGTAATTANNLTGIIDIDQDSNDDIWVTDNQGTITWSIKQTHPYFITLNSSLVPTVIGFYDSEHLTMGTLMWNGIGTGATFIQGPLSGTSDVDGDALDDNWTIDENGILTWIAVSAHPYSHPLGETIYYADVPVLLNNSTILYQQPGWDSLIAEDNVGIQDMDGDLALDNWYIVDGVINWIA